MEVPAKFKSALVGLRYSLLAFLIVATSAFLVSCGNTSSTKVTKGPDNLTITLSSDTTHPGEEVTVLVTVIDDNGDPIEGLTVEFSLPQNTSQAFLSALSGITDFNGQTTITYTAGPTSGGNDVLNAHIIIRSNGIKLELDANATIAVDPTLIGSLTISTGATSIVADGTSNTAVRATLVDVNGAAVVGEPVTFTTTLGTIIGSPATTNIDGIAQVTLRAGTITGTALVNGNAAGFSNNLQVQFLAGSPDEISITASPSTIAPLDTSTVIVTVLDGSDNPVANETIIFSIDDNESGGSFASLTAITNINGQAVVDYTAGAVEGTDDIRARAASNGIFDTEDILVETTTGAVVVGSLTLTSGSASLRANNIDFTTLRATVLDTGGQPVQNREVFFSSTLGTINGSPALTNSNGIAQVTLKAGYIAGIATAYAQTGGFNAQVDIPFTTGAPFLVDMTPTPSTISPLGTSTVFVTVEDSAGNRIPGETVIFSVEDNNTGGSFPVLTAVTDINGMAIVDYIGGGIAGTDEIRVRTASNGKDDTAFVTVDLSAAVIQSVTISAGDTELIADGTSQITVRALVLGVNNLPAVGVEVVFSSTLGTFPFGDSEFTDADGRAEVLLRSGTDVGIATVMASTGGFNDTIDIPFVADESNTLTITATPTTVIPLGTTSVAVELLDSFGSPVEGETIIFSIPTNESGGSFSELTAVTDINGMAVVQYTSGAAGIAPILDTIRARSATDADVDDTQVITIDDTSTALAGSLTLEVNDTILRADGEGNTAPGLPDRTQLKATLLDTNGDPVPATEIIFTTTLGTFSGASPYDTDPNGLATLELIAGETVGTAVVNAYFGGFNAQVEVQFVAGPPAGLTILATPTTISPLGTTSVLVTVVDGATTPNPVEGETIIFSIPTNASGGSFDSLTAVTDVNGMAVVQYTAGSNDDVWDNIAARTQSDAGVNDDEDILVSPAAGTNVKSLTLTSAEDTLIADGVVTPPFKSLLRATLLDLDDNPISGATIIFTTTLGDFATTPAAPYITDVNGVASIELEADSTLGIATVNVYYGGFNDQVQVNFVAGPADDITIVSPSGAPATAVPLSTQPVLVLVEDAADNPLEGETVLFSFVDNFSGASFSALSAVTNALGQATANYIAGGSETTGPDYDRIRARLASDESLRDNQDIDVTGTPNVGKISVSAPVTTLIADGTSTTTVTAVVLDPNDVPAPGVSVTISTTAGSINSAPPAYVLSDSGATDANGEFTVTFYSSTNLGTATITATAGGLFANTSMTFIAGPAADIALSASPVNLTADGISESEVSAMVTDTNGHLVANGENITFNLRHGSGGSLAPLSKTTENGIAKVTYTAGTDETVNGGLVDVRAEATNPTVDKNEDGLITLIAEVIYSIELTIDKAPPLALRADGTDYATLQATVRNTDLNLVADGTMVTFTTSTNPGSDGGDLGLAIPVTPGTYTLGAPTVDGVATMYLLSSTVAGQYMMQATAGSIDQFVTYIFEAGPADSTNIGTTLDANPASILSDGTSTALITLTALDANSNPVKDGTAVSFFTDAGTLSGATPTTTGGIATVTITSSIVPTATVNLEALIDGQSVTGTMAFVSSPGLEPNYIVLTMTDPDGSPSDGSLTVESPAGNDSILITATVYDGTGNLIPDCTDNIDFTIFAVSFAGDAKLDGQSNVYFPPPPAPGYVRKTTVNGVATVSLTPGTESGTLRVGARVRMERDCTALAPALQAKTTPIVVASGQAEKITIYANPNVVRNSDGTTSQIINALVTDIYGNPVADGTAVGWGLTDNGFTFPPDFGVICDTTFTGDAAPGLDCNPGGGLAAKGVARTLMTWLPEGIGVGYALGAETNTDAGLVADVLFGTYPAVADIVIIMTTDPGAIATSVYNGLILWAEMLDNSGVPLLSNPIDGQTISFTADYGPPEVIITATPDFDVTGDETNPSGYATADADIVNCSTSPITVTFFGSAGPYSGFIPIIVPANDQVADFIWGSGPASDEVTLADNSTLQSGAASLTYSWSSPALAGEFDTSPNPGAVTFPVCETDYEVTLQITNNEGCVNSVAKTVTTGTCPPPP